MKSIRLKILVWCFGIVFLSIVALAGVALIPAASRFSPMRFMREVINLQAEDAVRFCVDGDMEGLRNYLAKMDERFQANHYLADIHGIDVVTQADHSALLAATGGNLDRPTRFNGRRVMVVAADGGKYRFIVSPRLPLDPLAQLPYFLLIAGAMAAFCWTLAVDIAKPLQQMSEVVKCFGAGHLQARLRVIRKDEIGQLGIAFDQMADRIETLLRAERQLLQDISHELRTPLSRLGVAIQLVKRDDERDAAIHQLERDVDRLGVLAGDLVAMTKAEGDTSREPSELVRLDLLAMEIVENVSVEAHSKRCTIEFRNLSGELEIRGMRELLWRAIENIMRNAIRHTPAGTCVEVTLTSSTDAELTIRDHGSGVPEQELQRIFNAFYKVDPSRNSETGGVGLGLAIAQRAVNLHHGEITAENASPGLRVRIRLPL